MVRVFHLGLVAAVLSALSLARPLQPDRLEAHELMVAPELAVRSERSANLSHITGPARKIQMYIKNRHLQILPDGTVNGTSDDVSDYTILQRTSVNKGQLKIQGVATCLYLCMDSCGLLYGSKEFTKDCIFNEIFEQHHYNTYTSARYSDGRRTLYVALNKRGLPRKVQVRAGAPLRRLSTYTRTLTKPAPQAAVDRLLAAAAAAAAGSEPQPTAHPLRHHAHHQLCPVSRAPAQTPDDAAADGDADGRDKTRCRRRRKRKKRKRRCREGEPEGEDCQGRGKGQARRPAKGGKARRRCKDAADREQCRRQRQRQRQRRRGRDRSRGRARRRKQAAADSSFKDRTNQRDLEGSGSAEPAERLTAEAAAAAAEATTVRPQ